MAEICLISLNYAPEPIGIGPYSQGWAEHLAKRGHDVTVVCGVPYYPDWKLRDGFAAEFSESVENDVRVIRVPHYIPSSPTTLKRLCHYATFARNVRRGLGRKAPGYNPDLVIAIAPALVAAPAALRLARHANAPAWLHIQDFEVGAAVATGLLPSALASLAEHAERSIIRRFDRVSTISPGMVGKLRNEALSARPAVELRNWAEPSVGLQSVDGAAIREELGLPSGLIALYSGNLARKQGIGIIVEAAKAMEGNPQVQFVICGDGSGVADLAQASKDMANVHLRPLQSRERLPELLAMADIHLLPQIEGAADLVLPSKLANMLASGRPVVATSNHGTSLYAEVDGCGICVPAGDLAGFVQAIAALAEDPTRRLALGAAASRRARERWSKSVLLDQLIDEVETVLMEAA